MDLGKPGGGIIGHHDPGLVHRLCGGQFAPGLGTQMIAAKQDTGAVGLGFIRQAVDETDEPRWGQAGIAAILIDLI